MLKAERLAKPVGEAVSGREPWMIAICVMACLPSAFVLATWDSDGILSATGSAVRFLSLPVTAIELFVILIAMRSKFGVAKVFETIHAIPKSLIGIWLISAVLPIALAGQTSPLLTLTTMQYVIHGLCLAAGIYLACHTSGLDRDKGLLILTLGSLAYVGLLVIFTLTVPNKLEFPWTLRLPTGSNVRQIGYFVAIATVAPASLLLFGRSQVVATSIIIFVSTAFISWTGSRGALAGLFAGMIMALALVRQTPTWKRGSLAIASGLGGIVFSTLLPNPAPTFGLIRIASSFTQDDLGSGRMFIWESTLTEISKSPFLGHGSGSFKQNMWSIYGLEFNHPHQFILQYVYDWGVIGGISAILLIIMLFVFCYLRARKQQDAAAYASIAVMCVTGGVAMIDGPLFYPLSIFIALSIMICSFVEGKTDGKTGRSDL